MRLTPHSRLLGVALVVLLVAAGCKYHPLDTWSPGTAQARAQINALLDQAEAADASGDPVAAQVARDAAADLEAEHFLPSPAVGTTSVLVDPTLAGGFFDAPWPSDTRLRPDGSIDLTGFPGRATNAIANLVLGRGEAATFGFGPNSAVYFRASGALDPASVPTLAEATVQSRSTVLLLDLDDPTAPPVPLLVDYEPTGTPRRPSHLLTLLPYPGHPLKPATRYGAAVFNGLYDASGLRLAPSPILSALDGPAPAGVAAATWSTLRQDRDDTIQAVRDRTLWHPSELVAFTAFTTQDATFEMDAIARSVEALPPPEVLSRQPDATPCADGQLLRLTEDTLIRDATPPPTATTGPSAKPGGHRPNAGPDLHVGDHRRTGRHHQRRRQGEGCTREALQWQPQRAVARLRQGGGLVHDHLVSCRILGPEKLDEDVQQGCILGEPHQ